MSAVDIEELLRKTIVVAATYRFNVISVIADGAQCNRQFQKRYFNIGDKNMEKDDYTAYMIHPITSDPIYYVSDPSHMIKKCVSSLSSSARNIFMTVDGIDHQLSLSIMMTLWMSFNDNAGLNRFKEFKMVDFVKNSFQAMRVGPCIKVLGSSMIEMIDTAIIYKDKYEQFRDQEYNKNVANPYEAFKDAEKYGGWRVASVWFSKLFSILNSTSRRLNTTTYSQNLTFLKDFYSWFKKWKDECTSRTLKKHQKIHTSYEAMLGFFTAEATEDCLSMVQGIIQMTQFHCEKSISNGKEIYFIPRRISQDLVENGFATIKLGAKHGRLDHATTSASCVKSAVVKQLSISARNIKKRNIDECNKENENSNVNTEKMKYEKEMLIKNNKNEINSDTDETFADCVARSKKNATKRKNDLFDNKTIFAWKVIDGEEVYTNS